MKEDTAMTEVEVVVGALADEVLVLLLCSGDT